MRNFCAFLIGGLVSSRWLPRLDFVPCIALWVCLGFALGRAFRTLPGLPAGYALFVLSTLFHELPWLGAGLFGSCGTGVRGAVAELVLACLASGMLGSTLHTLATRRSALQGTGHPGLSPQ